MKHVSFHDRMKDDSNFLRLFSSSWATFHTLSKENPYGFRIWKWERSHVAVETMCSLQTNAWAQKWTFIFLREQNYGCIWGGGYCSCFCTRKLVILAVQLSFHGWPPRPTPAYNSVRLSPRILDALYWKMWHDMRFHKPLSHAFGRHWGEEGITLRTLSVLRKCVIYNSWASKEPLLALLTVQASMGRYYVSPGNFPRDTFPSLKSFQQYSDFEGLLTLAKVYIVSFFLLLQPLWIRLYDRLLHRSASEILIFLTL
jgi:hypothetical protein